MVATLDATSSSDDESEFILIPGIFIASVRRNSLWKLDMFFAEDGVEVAICNMNFGECDDVDFGHWV